MLFTFRHIRWPSTSRHSRTLAHTFRHLFRNSAVYRSLRYTNDVCFLIFGRTLLVGARNGVWGDSKCAREPFVSSRLLSGNYILRFNERDRRTIIAKTHSVEWKESHTRTHRSPFGDDVGGNDSKFVFRRRLHVTTVTKLFISKLNLRALILHLRVPRVLRATRIHQCGSFRWMNGWMDGWHIDVRRMSNY